MSAVDLIALAAIAVATLRGASIGLFAESLSITALGAAMFASRVWDQPIARWLQNPYGMSVNPDFAPGIAGVLVFAGVLITMTAFGRIMRQGVKRDGLGSFARVGGAALGMVEGALVACLLTLVVGSWLGRDHPSVADSASLALLEWTELSGAAPSDREAHRGFAGLVAVITIVSALALVAWNRWTSALVEDTMTDPPSESRGRPRESGPVGD